MPEYRYFPKGQTRTIIDYNAIIDLIALGQCAIVCLPVSVVGIIRKLLLDRGLWRTTYVLSYDDMGYYIPTEVEFNPIRQEILSALQELEDMSCSSDFRIGLADVANAIRALANAQCCSNIGVTIYQGTDEEGGVIFGTEPPGNPGNPETDPPPDGYDTWEEWYTQLCQNIHAMVDSFVTTLSNLSYLSIFNLSLLVSAVGAFILMPPAISPMLLYWLAQLVLSLSTLRDLGAWITANKSELVCAIYNADNAAAAQTAIRGVLSDGLTAANVDPNLHPTIISIAMALLSTDTLNQLYDGSMVVSYPGAECNCVEMPCTFTMSIGGIDEMAVLENGNILVRFVSALDPYAPVRQAIWWDMDGLDAAFSWVQASESLPQVGQGVCEGWWTHCDPPGTQVLRTAGNQGDGQWAGNWHRAYLWSQNNVQFTYEIELVCEPCE
jgi:hypothetical protein